MGNIFISYSHKDTAYINKLVRTLERHGFSPWVDERLDYGSQWPLELQEHLDSCKAFIVLMTPNSLASEWVQSELSRAKRKNKPIFPLLLEGDETWLSVESTQYVDVRGGILPPDKFYDELAEVTPRGSGSAPVTEAPSRLPTAEPVAEKPAILPVPATKARQFPTIAAIVGGIVILLFAGLWGAPKLFSPAPTATTSPTATLPVTNTPEPTPAPTKTPTAVLTPIVTPTAPLPTEIVDDKGVSMVLVPAGKFTMGSESGNPDERPVHDVYLGAFYIDKFEVTNTIYKTCVDTGTCRTPQELHSATHSIYYNNSDFYNYPVIYVDWNMADVYCKWRGAHLPTEADWEKAARGVDSRIYPFGASIDSTLANYNNNIGDVTSVSSYNLGKSVYGVYDLAGNVWEWTADRYDEKYYSSLPASVTNPLGPISGKKRVIRGGSWNDNGDTVRSANRAGLDLTASGNDLGFRCARDAQP